MRKPRIEGNVEIIVYEGGKINLLFYGRPKIHKWPVELCPEHSKGEARHDIYDFLDSPMNN